MDVIRKNNFPSLAKRLKTAMDACPNVSQAFRKANVQPVTAYGIAKGDKPSVELSALEDICRALGVSLDSLGVTFPTESQPLQPPSSAANYETVLGVWFHKDRTDFLSCYRRRGEWYLTNDTAMTKKKREPDGVLPLPFLEEER